ncbi:MAG: DUF1501 domain-containing protein, partial [Pirellulaceae bacterium]
MAKISQGGPIAIDRRAMLRQSAIGFGSLAASVLLSQSQGLGQTAPERFALEGFIPKAKRILFLFMKGGPSQVDTFDYKPMLERDHGKELPFDKPRVQFAPTSTLLRSPWKFSQYGQSGTWVSQLFPE